MAPPRNMGKNPGSGMPISMSGAFVDLADLAAGQTALLTGRSTGPAPRQSYASTPSNTNSINRPSLAVSARFRWLQGTQNSTVQESRGKMASSPSKSRSSGVIDLTDPDFEEIVPSTSRMAIASRKASTPQINNPTDKDTSASHEKWLSEQSALSSTVYKSPGLAGASMVMTTGASSPKPSAVVDLTDPTVGGGIEGSQPKACSESKPSKVVDLTISDDESENGVQLTTPQDTTRNRLGGKVPPEPKSQVQVVIYVSSKVAEKSYKAPELRSRKPDIPAFTIFNKLPPEIRIKIWKLVFPDPRIIELRFAKNRRNVNEGYHDLVDAEFPRVLHVCKEARYEALKCYKLVFESTHCRNRVYFNFAKDTLHIRDNCVGINLEMERIINTIKQLSAAQRKKIERLSISDKFWPSKPEDALIKPPIFLFPSLKYVTLCVNMERPVWELYDNERVHTGACQQHSSFGSCFPEYHQLKAVPTGWRTTSASTDVDLQFFHENKELVKKFLGECNEKKWGELEWNVPDFKHQALCLKNVSTQKKQSKSTFQGPGWTIPTWERRKKENKLEQSKMEEKNLGKKALDLKFSGQSLRTYV